MKSSIFILEFTVIDPTLENEYKGDKYLYIEDGKKQPGYYLGKKSEKQKSLFYLINRLHNYRVTKIIQNGDIITIK